MKEYGVDGVFVQRFVGQVRNKGISRNHNNRVLGNALNSAQKYKRAIAVMYDLSGMRDSIDVPAAYQRLEKHGRQSEIDYPGATNKRIYITTEKPLVALWGVGFAGAKLYAEKHSTRSWIF